MLYMPVFGSVASSDYFGNVPDEARQLASDGNLQLNISGQRQYKIGYKAACMTGRMAYLNDMLRHVVPEFTKAGITIAIENHDRFKSAALVHIVQTIASSCVGICLDTVNSFGALEGPDVVIDTLGPYVVNLHLKDFEIKRLDHNMGFSLTGTPAGAGMLDIPNLIARLKEFNRTFNAILELWPWWTGDTGSTIEMEDRWAQESVRYLKGVPIE